MLSFPRCLSLGLEEEPNGETSLDRLREWVKSVRSSGGGGAAYSNSAYFLCKHAFLWVCACNYGFPLTPLLYLIAACDF